MLGSILSKLKSIPSIVIILGGFVLLIALFGSMNSLLDRLGFHTTESKLQKQLTDVNNQNYVLNSAVDTLQKTLDETKDFYESQTKVIKETHAEIENTHKQVSTIKENLNKTNSPVSNTAQTKKVKTTTTVTYPIEEINEMSRNNIRALHTAYSTLFKANQTGV